MRSHEYLESKAALIRAFFGERASWVNRLDGHGGHIRIGLDDVTFADLQEISRICDGTKDINVHHEPAGGSEFTPTGDFMEIVVWGGK